MKTDKKLVQAYKLLAKAHLESTPHWNLFTDKHKNIHVEALVKVLLTTANSYASMIAGDAYK